MTERRDSAIFPQEAHLSPRAKVNLKGMDEKELEEFFASLGEKSFRAKQAMKWIYQKGESDLSHMSDLGGKLREMLKETARVGELRLMRHLTSREGDTEKFVFSLEDGNLVESVLMSYFDHLGPLRLTACISTQVGCGMGCSFCASGMAGLVRNLTTAEIIDQIIQMQRYIATSERRIANVVLMGIGEPLANYDNSIKAVRLINIPDGIAIGHRHITISTCGLVPQIYRLTTEEVGVKLAISLHGTTDQMRSYLMPINRKYPLAKLLKACRDYQERTGGRITFEYVLIRKLNDYLEDANRLIRMLKGFYCLVNLIPLNPIPEFSFRRSAPKSVEQFKRRLDEAGIKTTLRLERGVDIQAACGQLRRSVEVSSS